MENLGENIKENKLPTLLREDFRDKEAFTEKVKNEYRKTGKNNDRVDIANIRFVGKLIGKEKADNLSSQERIIFFEEIRNAFRKIEKSKKDLAEHWDKDAKRAGFVYNGRGEDGKIITRGDGEGLREFLKDN